MRYRRFLVLVITVVLLITAIPVYAEKHNFTIKDGVLTAYSGIGGKVVIPDEVTKIGEYAFKDNDTITKIIIPDSVTSISDDAFDDCVALTEVVLPNGLKKLGSHVFSGCESLTDVVIPDSVTELGFNTFAGCTSLESIEIPNGVVAINRYMFAGCSSLKEITVKEGNKKLTSVDGILFDKEMKNIIFYPAGKTESSYTLPDSVESIDSHAISCDNLRELTLSSNLSYIDPIGIVCYNLEVLNIPKGVIYIDHTTLRNCPKLSEINVEKGNSSLASEDGILYSADMKVLECYPTAAQGSVTVRDGVEVISNGAFQKCNKITEIILPDGVTTIKANAFANCTSLSSVKLPDTLKSIYDFAFSFCTALKSIYIPDGVERISGFVFSNTSINEFIIPEGVTKLDHMTLYGTPENDCVAVIPKSVKVTMQYNVICSFHTKVYCFAGSGIDEYCKTWRYPVIYMPETDINGDADGNGKINLSDVAEILKFASGKYNSFNIYKSDVNNDGMVNIEDALLIMMHIAKWDVKLK
ncbi:MAG: hypothetical protein E7578_06725 [Ruminococcaceae bacterium]|nr:hypothetical protein [Oscillospiraceae bacterium]